MASHLSTCSDEELYRAFRAGGSQRPAAFEEIYARYSQRVYVYCRRMTGNADDADDVFQDTFKRFYEAATAEGVTNILSYLLRSARNHFLNARRTASRWSPFTENDDVADHAPVYEREELHAMIAAALDLLDVSYREAFVLRFYEGLSYKEIADITGDSVSALKVRVMRAKDQIRTILAPYIDDIARF